MAEKPSGRQLSSTISVGAGIQVQIKGMESRFKSRYFGMKPDEFVIIQMPGVPSLKEKILSGCHMVVRFIHSGTIYGFEARVIGYALKPAPILFLSFPASVEAINLRNSQRIDTFLEVDGTINDNEIRGVIVDLSYGGCRFAVDRASGTRQIRVEPGDLVHIELRLSDKEKPFGVVGEAINAIVEANRIDVGLKFLFEDGDEADASASFKIKSYVDNVIAFLDGLSSDATMG